MLRTSLMVKLVRPLIRPPRRIPFFFNNFIYKTNAYIAYSTATFVLTFTLTMYLLLDTTYVHTHTLYIHYLQYMYYNTATLN